MNIFKEMCLSIYDFKSYKKFLNNKKSKVFLFGIVLMLFYFILTLGIPFAKFQITTGGIRFIAEETIPNFELNQGTMWMEDVLEYDSGDIFIHIDTTSAGFFNSTSERSSFLRGYSSAFIIDSEKLIFKNDGAIQEIAFKDMSFDFSKAAMLEYLPYLYAIIALIMFLAYLFMTAFFFFGVLFIALLSMIVASCMNYQLSFGKLYLLAIYARTLPLLIKAVVSLLPISIPFFGIINFGLSVLYIGLAIQKIKTQPVTESLELNSAIDNQF